MITNNNLYYRTIRTDLDLESLKNNNKIITELRLLKPCGKYDLSKIPNTVYKLSFGYKFENTPMEIPKFITEVEFYDFDYQLESLPTNINTVIIHKGFDSPVDNLGDNFITIGFGNNFNQPISDLPSSLIKIILGKEFTYPINNLPQNLKFLILHNPSYDFSTIFKLPKSLLLLQIGINNDMDLDLNPEYFDKSIKNHYHKEKNLCSEPGYFSHYTYVMNFYFFS